MQKVNFVPESDERRLQKGNVLTMPKGGKETHDLLVELQLLQNMNFVELKKQIFKHPKKGSNGTQLRGVRLRPSAQQCAGRSALPDCWHGPPEVSPRPRPSDGRPTVPGS